ncbi:MAG: hypothetical protein KKB37_14435 [Alphaproteobacteria bacterium]|nr:hypothetical protein [Alphaproteobacteria bacterium]
MKKLISACCFMALAAFGTTQNAKAASLDVDVDITLPGFLVLYCYDNIDINISAANLSTALGVTAGSSALVPPTGTQTATSGTITNDLDIAADTNTSLTTTVDLELQNICAVRGIGTSGSTADITISGVASTLSGGASSGTISVSAVTPSTASVALTGFGNLSPFDVTMSMDLANVIQADTFTNASAEFTVTALAP